MPALVAGGLYIFSILSFGPIDWLNSAESVLAFSLTVGFASMLRRRNGDHLAGGRIDVRRIVAVTLVLIVVWDLSGRWWGEGLPGAVSASPAAGIMHTYGSRTDPNGAGGFLQAQAATGEPVRFVGYDSAYIAGERNGPRGYRVRFRNPRAQALLVSNRAITLGLEDVQGYDPVQVLRYSDLIAVINGRPQEYHESNILPSGLRSPLLRILNVRYVIVPRRLPPGRPDLLHLSQRYPTVYSDSLVRIVEIDDALPRAWITRDLRQVEPGAALPLLAGGSIDPSETVVLEESVHIPADTAEAAVTVDAVTVTPIENDEMTLSVEAVSGGIVVISASYDPGWQAEIDGKPADVFVADHALMAIAIPAGVHIVTLRYEAPGLALGLAISSASVALLIVMIVFAPAIERRWPGRRLRQQD